MSNVNYKVQAARSAFALAMVAALAACGGGGGGSSSASISSDNAAAVSSTSANAAAVTVVTAVTPTGSTSSTTTASATASAALPTTSTSTGSTATVGTAGTTTVTTVNGGTITSTAPGKTVAPSVAGTADETIVPVTRPDAQRLLEQAAFGPTETDIASVQALGIPGWIRQQMATSTTGYPGFFYVDPFKGAGCSTESHIVAQATDALMIRNCSRDYYTPAPLQRKFFTNALNAPDQLRQRVAFALSQIFVTSGYEAYAQADYQNMLLNDAFGNFKTLMTDVTLHPTMGDWLDMVGNDKPNPAKGTQANENYAREFMQLFTVGTSMLNADGSPQLDSNGKPLPVYTQAQVTDLARAFTGWAYPPHDGQAPTWNAGTNHMGKMVAFDVHHDMDVKTIIGGVVLPAGQTAQADLDGAITAVFNHPNVGPFISKQLIQKLVTSNPTPAYVARVTAAFNDNGAGVRGDMAAVVMAILTDSEARGDVKTDANYGKLREPAVYMASILRTLGGSTDGVGPSYWSTQQGEPLFISPSVFNYFSPAYVAPGTTLYGPEFGVLNTSSQILRTNFVAQMIFLGGVSADASVTGSIGTHVNMAGFGAFTDRAAAVAKMNDVLLHNSLSTAGTTAVMRYLNMLTTAQIAPRPTLLTNNSAYLMLTAPQYEIQK
ncbi:DUF1800 domain-containing protein [Amantichitinum ursilacus]|uniref:DUF1800 domain-containing protein n=1 Tax=Amantichitinum ursilacus TaxID=857265 RepID=A0A0N0GQE4_9NEIS|nr:DUF1800 domain-containing protein [Amantichitinum ursilacus]KPC54712.1 hypothetical protein WG78_04035 [Amantichitinum ursilacus]